MAHLIAVGPRLLIRQPAGGLFIPHLTYLEVVLVVPLSATRETRDTRTHTHTHTHTHTFRRAF